MSFFTEIPAYEDSKSAGLKYFYIGRDGSTSLTIDASGINGTWDSSAMVADEFVKITPKSETLKAMSTLVADPANGAVAYEHSVTFQINQRDTSRYNFLQLAAQSKVKIVTVDMYGVGRVYGGDNGLKLTASVADSGDKMGGSLNGFTFEFKETNMYPDILLSAQELGYIE